MKHIAIAIKSLYAIFYAKLRLISIDSKKRKNNHMDCNQCSTACQALVECLPGTQLLGDAWKAQRNDLTKPSSCANGCTERLESCLNDAQGKRCLGSCLKGTQGPVSRLALQSLFRHTPRLGRFYITDCNWFYNKAVSRKIYKMQLVIQYLFCGSTQQ